MLLVTFKISFKIFLISILIRPNSLSLMAVLHIEFQTLVNSKNRSENMEQNFFNIEKSFENCLIRKIKQILFDTLASEDYYIDLQEILPKVKLNLFSS